MGAEAKRFIDVRDGLGLTPLHLASFWQHEDLKEQLLAFGADASATDMYGKTPKDLSAAGAQAPQFIAH